MRNDIDFCTSVIHDLKQNKCISQYSHSPGGSLKSRYLHGYTPSESCREESFPDSFSFW